MSAALTVLLLLPDALAPPLFPLFKVLLPTSAALTVLLHPLNVLTPLLLLI
jgi:hypothetical protein